MIDFARGALHNRIRQLEIENAALLKANGQLATWQCPYLDGKQGLTSDEHGHQFCAMAPVVIGVGIWRNGVKEVASPNQNDRDTDNKLCDIYDYYNRG